MQPFSTLTDSEKKDLSDLDRLLRQHGSIPKILIQPKTGLYKDNLWYDKCREYEDWLQDYLEISGLQLCHDAVHGIFYLRSMRDTGRALTEFETCILLLLRLLYEEKIEDMSEDMIWTTQKEIREKGMDTGLLLKKPSAGMMHAFFKYLKKQNVLAYAGNTEDLSEDARIYILDTIVIVLPQDKLSEAVKYAKKDELSEVPEEEDVYVGV